MILENMERRIKDYRKSKVINEKIKKAIKEDGKNYEYLGHLISVVPNENSSSIEIIIDYALFKQEGAYLLKRKIDDYFEKRYSFKEYKTDLMNSLKKLLERKNLKIISVIREEGKDNYVFADGKEIKKYNMGVIKGVNNPVDLKLDGLSEIGFIILSHV